ncbi:cation diffusion facilitator family transporter [Palleronia sp. LCG004]|uniref:cation diffusion facilitator family transporter n=1 Tax=Palleronia sp. LCG004 TaxID=3079304 RepID=UPI00294220F3|nr:cation diffusion facilitator family transporter [Palleronia sp. LCG004]WOI56464.1 cation diffusion facilitator family transporter [Palleronia sp. LCG004]
MDVARNNRLNLIATGASVLVAMLLVLAKFWALAATGSLSVAASLADSALDLMVSLAGFAAVRYAQRPPDHDHAFGHSSAEDLAALGQSAFILVSSIAIAVAAIMRIATPEDGSLANEGAGIAVMVFGIVLTIGLVILQSRIARTTGNRVVLADRLHYLSDLLPNLGAIVALFVSARFGIFALDSFIALAAAVLLAAGAIRIAAGAWNALMDRAAPDEMVRGIETLARNWPGLHGHHDLKTRTAGSRVFVNIHVEIDGSLTLAEAHDIGAGLRRAILEKYPQTDVIIHKDPVRGLSPE